MKKKVKRKVNAWASTVLLSQKVPLVICFEKPRMSLTSPYTEITIEYEETVEVNAEELLTKAYLDMVNIRESGDLGSYPPTDLEKQISEFLNFKASEKPNQTL